MQSSRVGWGRRGIAAAVVFMLNALAGASAEEPTLAMIGLPRTVVAGTTMNFWLTALNPSSTAVSWTVPRKIGVHFASSAATSEASARLADPTQGATVLIAPGGFTRIEYRLPIGKTLTGDVVLELRGLAVSRVVLDVQPPPAAPLLTEHKESLLSWFLRDAEPKEAGTALEPGEFFKKHFFGYDPFYFIAGTESPNARFQLSFKYRVLNEDGRLAEKAPVLKGLHLAYTQTSLWDWNAESRPFYDSSYKPEVLYSWDRVAGGQSTDWFRLDLQGGFQHESNGKSGADSRSLNIAYLRPTFVFGRDDHLQLTLIPRIWGYIGDLEDNPDLKDYRGYGDLRAALGWKHGLQVSALGRLGDDWDHGSLQLDATYPMMRMLKGSFSLYLHAQYFTGYGESLLGYRERSAAFRLGISLYR